MRQISLDYSKLVGIPYEEKDCYRLVQHFYRLHGVELKEYYQSNGLEPEESVQVVDKSKQDFKEVSFSEMRYGDILVINILGTNSHVGVYIGDGLFLHTRKRVGSSIEKVRTWNKLIVGVFRAIQ